MFICYVRAVITAAYDSLCTGPTAKTNEPHRTFLVPPSASVTARPQNKRVSHLPQRLGKKDCYIHSGKDHGQFNVQRPGQHVKRRPANLRHQWMCRLVTTARSADRDQVGLLLNTIGGGATDRNGLLAVKRNPNPFAPKQAPPKPAVIDLREGSHPPAKRSTLFRTCPLKQEVTEPLTRRERASP